MLKFVVKSRQIINDHHVNSNLSAHFKDIFKPLKILTIFTIFLFVYCSVMMSLCHLISRGKRKRAKVSVRNFVSAKK